jgi:hypothetical protein
MKDMSDSAPEPVVSAETTIAAAVRAVTGKFVTKWVLCAEIIDDDGAQVMEMYRDPTTARWDRIGMLTYAIEVEKVRVHRDTR